MTKSSFQRRVRFHDEFRQELAAIGREYARLTEAEYQGWDEYDIGEISEREITFSYEENVRYSGWIYHRMSMPGRFAFDPKAMEELRAEAADKVARKEEEARLAQERKKREAAEVAWRKEQEERAIYEKVKARLEKGTNA